MAEQIRLLVSHHRGKLLKVAYHKKLNTAEWLGPVTKTSKYRVHRIKQVASHHTDLVNYEDINSADDTAFLFAERKL